MARPKTEAATYDSVFLRLPGPLLATIKAQAAEGRRPINTQVIMLLEKAIETEQDAEEYYDRQRQARSP